jgi:hypothetical protein
VVKEDDLFRGFLKIPYLSGVRNLALAYSILPFLYSPRLADWYAAGCFLNISGPWTSLLEAVENQ